MSILNSAAYRFVSLENLEEWQQVFRQYCQQAGLKGSIVLSPEGINLMMAGAPEVIAAFKAFVENQAPFQSMEYKDSFSDYVPFKRLFVKIKPMLTPFCEKVDVVAELGNHLPPKQLKQWLDEKKDFVFIDVRNDYEIQEGGFEKAISLGLKHFRDFDKAVANLPEEMKSKPIVTCCTGGIRCEKVVPYMHKQGFQEVYQLEGGILEYLKECGDVHYEGACYVFDERVAIKKAEIV